MFCPNCGTQNDSATKPCKKCGFKLSGVSASKFKGTMMLNSEQSAQDFMARQEMAKAEATVNAEAPGAEASPETTSSPPPVVPKGAAGVLQPPRVAVPRRRMGGTMLGVAPQAGGISPPKLTTTAETPAAGERAASAAPEDPANAAQREPGPPVAVASTVAMPMMSPARDLPGASGTAEEPPADEDRHGSSDEPRSAAAETEPAAEARETANTAPAAPSAAAAAQLEVRSSERQAAPTAQMPANGLRPEPTPGPKPSPVSDPLPQRRRVNGLDIFLIIITCGLYGLVLLFRRRKQA